MFVLMMTTKLRIDQLYGNGKTVYRTMVYSLKLGSWKIVKNCSYCFPHLPRENQGVFLNGALHWKSWDMIIKFDLGTEEYSQLPLPPVAGEPFETHLNVFGGCLVLSYYYLITRFDGWIMKEKAWTKLFSLGKLDIMGAMGNLETLAYSESKRQVVLQHDDKFFLLDIEKNSAKKVTIRGFPDNFYNFSSQICPGNLFRLDECYEVCRTVATKRTRAQRKRANARRKLCATTTDIWYRSDSDYNSASSWSSDADDY